MKLVVSFTILCVLVGAIILWRVGGALPFVHVFNARAAGPVQPPPVVSAAPEVIAPDVIKAARPPAPLDSSVHWAADPAVRAAEATLHAAQSALLDDPHNAAALRDELAALRTLGRWDAAAATLAKLIELEPDDPQHPFERAGILLRLRRWVEAASAYRDVVDRQPQRVDAWFNLAVAHHAARHLSDARAAWDRVLSLRPDDVLARAHRAEVLLDLREWSAAATDLRAVLASRPDDVETALNLALALRNSSATRDALDVIEGALARRSRDVRLLNRAAELYWSLFESGADASADARNAAQDYWRRSLAVDPSQTDVARQLSVSQE